MIQPKYVALDTSTWIQLFKHQTDAQVKDILDVLNSGEIVIYVSFEHVLELVQGSDGSSRLEQLDFFRAVKHVGFPKPISFPAPWRNSPLCGSYQDVQGPEISALFEDPGLTLEQVVERVRPTIVAGFASGMDFAKDAVLRELARSGSATRVRPLNQAAVSVLHAALQNATTVIPEAGQYALVDRNAAEQRKPQLIAWFAQQFSLSGIANPDQRAAHFVEQAFQVIFEDYDLSGADSFRELAGKVLGLEVTRLPPGSTQRDWVLETLFRSRMATHERRMRLPDRAAYTALTWHKLPSFVAWFELDQAARSNMPAPEGSNMIDFPLAALGLYIDKVQVDKRVLHQARVAANKNSFLERLYNNLFRSKDLKDLLHALSSL